MDTDIYIIATTPSFLNMLWSLKQENFQKLESDH